MDFEIAENEYLSAYATLIAKIHDTETTEKDENSRE